MKSEIDITSNFFSFKGFTAIRKRLVLFQLGKTGLFFNLSFNSIEIKRKKEREVISRKAMKGKEKR